MNINEILEIFDLFFVRSSQKSLYHFGIGVLQNQVYNGTIFRLLTIL